MIVATVRQWTGHEARALRQAKRMSVRQFADHLGLTAAAVSNWERRGEQARLRYETQQILDIDLARSADDVRQRFDRSVVKDHPPPVTQGLGHRSTKRTEALLAAAGHQRNAVLRYRSPVDPSTTIAAFLASPSRAYVIKGPPGCGKTSLTHHLAQHVDGVDFQLHAADSWSAHGVDLAAEILRYASTDAGQDSLLTLEAECAALTRPTVAVIDGPTDQSHAQTLFRQLDLILRQVLSGQLRFCLVQRTPPDIDFSAHPVLAATVMRSPEGVDTASLHLQPWGLDDAREVWNDGLADDDMPFDQLPSQVRQLARVPLYMRLLKLAGPSSAVGEATAYRLVDFCVRSIASRTGNAATAMTHLAALAEDELSHLVPSALSSAPRQPPRWDSALAAEATLVPLLRQAPSGRPTFGHDIVREYFFATRIAQLIEDSGRSAASIAAINDLATHAGHSATARGALELTIQRLDAAAPDLLAAVALSPTISIASSLPLMLDVTGDDAAFATDEVLRSCASRSLHDNGLNLAKALLHRARLVAALADHHSRWLVEVLRQFGSAIWPDVVQHAETHLSSSTLRTFLHTANLATAADAVFFARHAAAFFGDDPHFTGQLTTLLEHADWRVRAALADGLRGWLAPHPVMDTVVDILTRDSDYKVRAAVAAALGQIDTTVAATCRGQLALDGNWHVRDRLVNGLATATAVLDENVCDIISSHESWRDCPAHVRTSLERLLLLSGTSRNEPTEPYHRALFSLLREVRTRSLTLPDELVNRIVVQADGSEHWLVRAEAENVRTNAGWSPTIRSGKEAFRRLRDSRSIQIALDLRDIDQATKVAEAAAQAGAQFVEVGDPLIKSIGVAAIGHIKQQFPDLTVVAEMMSADWGRDQVVLAAEAGADVVLLIGPASTASVAAAVEASTRLGVPLVLDIPERHLDRSWVQAMERTGVDGFAVTTNIDLGAAGPHPLERAEILRTWTKLPVAVSGGFGTTDTALSATATWDILVVGRSVTDAVDPTTAARQLIDHATARRPKDRE